MRKKKTVIKVAHAPATRAPLRLTVGVTVLLVGVAAWEMVATHSPKANPIV